MDSLPTRKQADERVGYRAVNLDVASLSPEDRLLIARADGYLMTRQEFIDSLDYNDLADRLIRHCIGLDAASTCTLRQVKEWLAATGENADG